MLILLRMDIWLFWLITNELIFSFKPFWTEQDLSLLLDSIIDKDSCYYKALVYKIVLFPSRSTFWLFMAVWKPLFCCFDSEFLLVRPLNLGYYMAFEPVWSSLTYVLMLEISTRHLLSSGPLVAWYSSDFFKFSF